MDEAYYATRIAAASEDAVELARIADELQGVPGSAAAKLRLRAIGLRVKLRQPTSRLGQSSRRLGVGGAGSGCGPDPTRPAAEPRGVVLAAWLGKLGITAIDERPLYQYRIAEEGFEWLQHLLVEQRHALGSHSGRERAGQFVLWAAEWFRRCYDGTGQRWDALGAELNVQLQWTEWRHLTDTGLRFWKLKPLRLNGVHHRLAAIAQQGGFPCAAIERGAGWAPSFLEALVSQLAAVPDPQLDAADAVAERLIGMVPDTWRSREIRVVSAELALEVVALRREAEAHGVPEGALISSWLDQHRAGWRDRLPLPVGSEAARSLINGLMRTVTLRGGSESVRCNRWLEVHAGGRRVGIELELSGLLKDVTGKALTSGLAADWSRLRLYAAGDFAQHVFGELAVADPDGQGQWLSRASTTRTRYELPNEIAITTELRGDGRRVVAPFVLAGGEPVRSDLRVYARDAEGEVSRFRLIGTGSGGFREEQLFIDVPDDWAIETHGDDAVAAMLPDGAMDGRALWRVGGTVVATNTRGDRYLLRANQQIGQRDSLLLHGERVQGCELADGQGLFFQGAPTARVQEGRRDRAASNDELWWRPAGSSAWRSGISCTAPGPCEFAWRDKLTGHIRDRADAVIAGEGFQIRSQRVGEWHEVQVDGWDGSIEASAGIAHGPSCWRLPLKGNTRSRLLLTLRAADEREFGIAVPIRHQAWIESWSDGPTPRNARLSLSTINKYVARADGRCELMADLLDRSGRPVSQRQASWWVEGELPLSSIRDDLAALLRPYGDIRAMVRLNFNDANEDYWMIGEFGYDLKEERGGFVPEPAMAEQGVRIVRRELAQPEREHDDLGVYNLIDTLNHRPIALPRHHGAWLVYLRASDRILSCPRIDPGQPMTSLPPSQLGRVMTLPDEQMRAVALRELYEDVAADPTGPASRKLVRQLIDLALSLDGLPPGTFDALRLVGDKPLLGPLMLYQARSEEIEPLLRLAEGLPFAWWLIPAANWDRAEQSQAEYLFKHFPDDVEPVAHWIGQRRATIAAFEPILAPFLKQAAPKEPLEVAANGFLNRSSDRIQASIPNPFRPRLDDVLPSWLFSETFWRALDAPVAAALAARQRITLLDPEVAAAKDMARKHPRWFQEAFAAAVMEH